jgi:hypothetical protein
LAAGTGSGCDGRVQGVNWGWRTLAPPRGKISRTDSPGIGDIEPGRRGKRAGAIIIGRAPASPRLFDWECAAGPSLPSGSAASQVLLAGLRPPASTACAWNTKPRGGGQVASLPSPCTCVVPQPRQPP